MSRLWAWLGFGPGEAALLALALLLPPLAVQRALPVPRLDADAVEYFSHLRSLYFDHDLDFANEFEHFGILSRYDKIRPTATGHRRTIFSVGPALAWMPFYAAGDLLARASGQVEAGYSPFHIRAVCVASAVYGALGLLLVYRLLRNRVGRGCAVLTILLLEYATFLYWYMAQEAAMSHTLSFCAAAAVLAAWWDGRESLSLRRGLVVGLLTGLAATMRWQNGVLLLLPAASLLGTLGRRPVATLRTGALTLAAFALGALPQALAWKAIFGQYLLADPPHGSDFLRLGHPYLLNTFFSSRHGLLYWTPLLWTGFLGLPLLRRERRTSLMLLLPLAVMTYVNACSGDWWAGGSFSNRRFDSTLPLLAFGLAAVLAGTERLLARRPGIAIGVVGTGLVVSNLLFMQQYRENRVPRDGTVSFAGVAENSAGLVAGAVGSPLAWPANWVFAAQHSLGPDRYDKMVGQYLFYRQNNLGGVIDLGDERTDPGLLDEGWGPLVRCGDASCRAVLGEARLFAPLDVPETLDVRVRAAGEGTLALAVNGALMADLPLSGDLQDLRVRVPAQRWRRELNEVRLGLAGGRALVDRVVFERVGAK